MEFYSRSACLVVGIALAAAPASGQATHCVTGKQQVRIASYSAAQNVYAPKAQAKQNDYAQKHEHAQIQAVKEKLLVLSHVPAIRQGSTYYSSHLNLELIDADRLAAQALALQKAAIESQTEYHSATLAFLERVIALQQPTAEILARGQATQAVVDAATRSLQTSAEQETINNDLPLVAQTCGKCHSGTNAKGGFDLGGEFNLTKALQAVSSGSMPPDGSLSPEDRIQVLDELVRFGIAKSPNQR